MNTTKTQLEMNFDHSERTAPAPLSSRRRPSAHLWFQQMHVVVHWALDWSTAPAPPPQQITISVVE